MRQISAMLLKIIGTISAIVITLASILAFTLWSKKKPQSSKGIQTEPYDSMKMVKTDTITLNNPAKSTVKSKKKKSVKKSSKKKIGDQLMVKLPEPPALLMHTPLTRNLENYVVKKQLVHLCKTLIAEVLIEGGGLLIMQNPAYQKPDRKGGKLYQWLLHTIKNTLQPHLSVDNFFDLYLINIYHVTNKNKETLVTGENIDEVFRQVISQKKGFLRVVFVLRS